MEFIMLRTVLLLTLLCLVPNLGHTTTTDTETGPKMYVAENVYEFEPVLEGMTVIHDFILYNRGDEPLEILRVKSG